MKQACANVAGAPPVAKGVALAKRAVAPKPGQKKVTVKPKSEEVIDIDASPDKTRKRKRNHAVLLQYSQLEARFLTSMLLMLTMNLLLWSILMTFTSSISLLRTRATPVTT
ncbi:hypothetical protein GLYMA_03G124002v4 [Glycine max]|nr:hypothetical protein GLYMA_03G124002v4 [Glycine max]KAH1069676.1 hypothetical protein GYH30_007029 [Glycine max]